MLVLFETPAGLALFKVLDEGKMKKPEAMYKHFADSDKANNMVKLVAFDKFEDTTSALATCTALVEGKLNKDMKSFLSKWCAKKHAGETLGLSDNKLAAAIKEKLDVNCTSDEGVRELLRGIRSQMDTLITGMPDGDLRAMSLGLAHSLSRYKLKFSPDKVDTMIIQAIGLLDDLDKELNTYSMRAREWYGLHFPELSKLIPDNVAYAQTVIAIKDRSNTAVTDLSYILPEEIETDVKKNAEISMGSDISEQDIENIVYLCEQVVSIGTYRTELYDYLKNRMNAIAPNLTIMVGELVGARLIAHAGSLLNLAKHPASTVQILGAEKALFRALKAKSDTPKYGLIYHASLVGQSAPKNKGKISRVLAAKTALSIRVDALGENLEDNSVGYDNRLKVEQRLAQLEGRPMKISGQSKAIAKAEKFEKAATTPTPAYNAATDSTLKRKASDEDSNDEDDKAAKKAKKAKKEDKKSEKKAKKEKKTKKEKK